MAQLQSTVVSGNTSTTGFMSAGGRRLSMGILDLNSSGTPTQFKIKTTIPWNSGGADFTVNIKGFRYGGGQMVSLSVGWHHYNNTFYNEAAICNGGWAPVITLAKSPDNFVIIHLAGPGYWPKLYVESLYSSAYTDSYASGWTWSDADLTDCTDVSVVPYNILACNISGNAVTTSQTNFATLTLNSAAVATQAWVQSQGYLTSVSDIWVNTTGDTMTGALTLSSTGSSHIILNNTTATTGKQWRVSSGSDGKFYVTHVGVIDAFTILPTSGNVGIGTSNPVYKFEVSDGTRTGVFNPNSVLDGFFIGTKEAKPLILGSSDTERLRITSGGNVGVGTISPTLKFQIDTTGFSLRLRETSDGSSLVISGNQVQARTSADAGSPLYLNYTNGGNIYTGSGSVGIGTTSPRQLLELFKTSNPALNIHDGGTGELTMGIAETDNYAQFNTNTNGFRWYTGQDGQSFPGTGTERMRITSAGNVGIGISTPAARFTTRGSGTWNTNFATEFLTTDNMLISSEMTNDAYNSILQLVSVRQSLTTGNASQGFLGFSTIDDSNAQGIRDAGRIAIVNEVTSARNSATGLAFWTNAGGTNTNPATEKMRITSGGNVGIGTTNPGAKLEVYNGDIWLNAASAGVNPEIRFIDDSGISVAGAKIRYGNNDGSLYIEHVYNEVTSGIFFRNQTGGTALNTLSLVNGKVGIQATAPISKLQIGSSWTANPGGVNTVYLAQSGFVNSNLAPELIITTNIASTTPGGAIGLALHNSNTTAGAFAPLLVFSKTETGATPYNASIAAIGARTVTGSGNGDAYIDGELIFYTAPTLGTGLVERLRITQDGQVLMGTTSTQSGARLQVAGGFLDVWSSANTLLRLRHDGTRGIIETFTSGAYSNTVINPDGGNVGIGNTSPTTYGGYTVVHIGSTSSVGLIKFGTGTSLNGPEIFTNSTNNLYFNSDSSSTRLTILGTNGNVGIGTASPTSKLFVQGDGIIINNTTGQASYASGIKFRNDGYEHWTAGVKNANFVIAGTGSNGDSLWAGASTVDRFVITSTGNVGINATGATYRLEVVADAAGLFVSGAGVSPYNQKIATFRYAGNGNDINIENQGGKAAIQARAGAAVMDLILNGAGGNVGIAGITAPTNKLHIKISDAIHANEGIYFESPSGYGGAGIYHDYNQGNGQTAFKIHNTYSGAMVTLSQESYNAAGSPGSVRFYTSTSGGANTPIERGRITPRGTFVFGDVVIPSEDAWYGTGVFGKNSTDKVITGYLTSSTNGAVIGGHNSPLNAWANLNISGVDLIFRYAESETMRLTSTQRLGLGTSTPQKKLDVVGTGIVASFGGVIGVGNIVGISFGYSESIYNNDLYKKAALVFERTESHSQGSNASGKIHFLLNNTSSTSATALTDAVVTIDSGATGSVGSVRMGIGTRNPTMTLDVVGEVRASGMYGTSYSTLTSGAGTGTAVYDTLTTSGAGAYEVVIVANPNAGGSGSYRDWYIGTLVIGTGYNGAAVVHYIDFIQQSPMPRTLFGSGGGNLTVTAVFNNSGTESEEATLNASYIIRFKISGYSTAATGAATTIYLKKIGI